MEAGLGFLSETRARCRSSFMAVIGPPVIKEGYRRARPALGYIFIRPFLLTFPRFPSSFPLPLSPALSLVPFFSSFVGAALKDKGLGEV